jgi:signal transduction histidine kinase/ActR/RegA family two-component response regulator
MIVFPPGYVVSPIIAVGVTVVLIVLLIQAGFSDRSRRLFLLVLISLELWSVFTLVMRSTRVPETAIIWDRALSAAILGLFVTFFHFCHAYMGYKSRWPVVLVYALFVPASAIILFTNLAIERIRVSWFGYAPVVGSTGIALFAAMQLLISINLVRLFIAWRKEPSIEKRKRYLALGVAGLLPILGGAFDGFTDLPPMAIWTNLAFCTVCTVAILHFRLFDLRVFARKRLIHFLVSTLIATPYVGAIILFMTAYPGEAITLWVYISAVLAFALLLRPAYEWARLGVDRLFYRERYDYLEVLRGLVRSADTFSSLEQFSPKLTELVRGAMRASSVSLLQPVAEGQELCVIAKDGVAVGSSKAVLRIGSPLVQWLKSQRTVLATQKLAVEPALQNIPKKERAALGELQSTLLVPLLTPRDELSGLLILGPKDSHRSYSIEDLQLLESLGVEAALSLENVRLYRDAVRVRETLQAWLNNLPDVIVIVDSAGIIRFINKEAVERLGQRVGQRSFFCAQMQSGSGATQRFTETIRNREYEIAPAPLVDPDGRVSTVYVMRDITERKKEQAQREQLETRARLASHMASIGEMASGIAHEINNPLTAVIGYSQLLAQHPLPAESGEAVEQILQGATRVAGIVQRLLTFARQQKPTRCSVDLNEVIRSTLALRAYALKTANIRVVTRLDPLLPTTIVDGQQMQQVILNLIINAETAMKAAHQGGELVLASAVHADSILLTVADNGPGIPYEIQDRIFDPFFTTREEGQGTGLGLSICHGIVKEHGGRIWVHSEPGKGATFTVELLVVCEAAKKTEPRPASQDAAHRKTRILVVDDEPSVCRLLQRLLEEAGHQVDAAPDGRTALERIARQRYGLILLDVRMPEMSGMEVYEKAREIAASVAERIIFLTGDIMAPELQSLLARTGAPFLTKPFQTQELLQTLSLHLDRGLDHRPARS